MLDCASVEKHKVEDFGPLADIFLPLGESTAGRLGLRAQILEQAQKSPVFNVGRLRLNQAFHFLEVVVDFMRLLHVVLVGCLKHTSLALLVVEESEFDLDIHGVFKLLDALLHRAKVAGKVVFGFFLDEGEYYCELVEEVVDGVQDRVHWQVCIC